ncbi:hypothetical protein NHX12_031391 [Muraenolepis orangiensis]|uniref:Cytochrome P450 n=2 Tax=Muraenolepis orangiensis TaxID=630683 RepID=A0A9Q0E9I9_9TELE|nr:hypothetical protein NHX12_031391 [Muraenolepis orangiensis]
MELLEVLHSMTSVTLLGAVIFLLVLFFFSRSRNLEQRKEPPGPRPLPLIGNLLQLDFMKPHITLWELSKKYGHVFTVYLGPKKVVVLAGYKTVKQALVNNAEEFGERELIQIAKSFGGHGILFANGESWKEMRRFALTTLRDFGMGKKISEEKMIEECQNLMEVFEQYKGKAFDTTQSINYAVSNIICSIVYGSRFEYDDPEFIAMVNRANETIRLAGSPSVQIYNMFPWLGKWFGSSGVCGCIPDPPEDSGGQLQEELSSMIGSRQVRVEDRKNLPYTDAVIHEIQRLANIVPMSLPHTTSQDITFQGYFIKKGTVVYPLLTSVLWDETEWESPLSFNPSHFLDKDRKFVKRDAFMPFSAGRRACVGESLARMELFLFFTTLLQHYRFTPPPGVTEDELDLTPTLGLTLNPSPHQLCAHSRV